MRTKFSSDNGARCHMCRGTIFEYHCDDLISLVETVCVSCRACNLFQTDKTPTTPAEASAAHRAAVR